MVEDIVSNAKAEEKVVLSDAKKQVAEILAKGEAVAEKEKQAIIEAESKAVKELEKQQIASINLNTRREILQKKEEEINKVFDLAKEELKKFAKKDAYKKVLESLIIEAGTAIGGGNLQVIARKEDKTKLSELSKAATQITKLSGTKSTLKVSKETIDSIGGVVVRLDDESITIDNTFEARLDQKYRTIRTQVANTLFS